MTHRGPFQLRPCCDSVVRSPSGRGAQAAPVRADPSLHGQGVTTPRLQPRSGSSGWWAGQNEAVKSKNVIWSGVFKGKSGALGQGLASPQGPWWGASFIPSSPYRRIIGWKRPLRSSSPTIHPTPPFLLNRIPKCHIYTFFVLQWE